MNYKKIILVAIVIVVIIIFLGCVGSPSSENKYLKKKLHGLLDQNTALIKYNDKYYFYHDNNLNKSNITKGWDYKLSSDKKFMAYLTYQEPYNYINIYDLDLKKNYKFRIKERAVEIKHLFDLKNRYLYFMYLDNSYKPYFRKINLRSFIEQKSIQFIEGLKGGKYLYIHGDFYNLSNGRKINSKFDKNSKFRFEGFFDDNIIGESSIFNSLDNRYSIGETLEIRTLENKIKKKKSIKDFLSIRHISPNSSYASISISRSSISKKRVIGLFDLNKFKMIKKIEEGIDSFFIDDMTYYVKNKHKNVIYNLKRNKEISLKNIEIMATSRDNNYYFAFPTTDKNVRLSFH